MFDIVIIDYVSLHVCFSSNTLLPLYLVSRRKGNSLISASCWRNPSLSFASECEPFVVNLLNGSKCSENMSLGISYSYWCVRLGSKIYRD